MWSRNIPEIPQEGRNFQMTREEHWCQLLRAGGVVYESRNRSAGSEAQSQMIWHVSRRCRKLRGSESLAHEERYTGGHETTTKSVELCIACARGSWTRMLYGTTRTVRKLRRLRVLVTGSILAWPAVLISVWLQPGVVNLTLRSPFVTAVVQGIVIAVTLKWSSTAVKEWQRLRFLALVERTSWRYMSMVCNEGDSSINNIGIPVNEIKVEIVKALIADMKIAKDRCVTCFGINEIFRFEALITDVGRWIESMLEDAKRGAPLNPKIFRRRDSSVYRVRRQYDEIEWFCSYVCGNAWQAHLGRKSGSQRYKSHIENRVEEFPCPAHERDVMLRLIKPGKPNQHVVTSG